MPYVPVSGTRLYYEETGPSTGRPLLLLHAALQTSESMEPLRKLMAPYGCRIITADQRGHGRSANPGRSFSVKLLADDIATLISHLGLERPVIAGYSLGGIVGLELARRGMASALVVLASRFRPARKGRKSFDPDDIRRRSPVWAKQLAERHVEIPWDELAVELGALLEDWVGFSPADLASITCPVLVVQGDRDEMVSFEQGQALAAAIPGAIFQPVPRAGHPELLYRQDALQAVEACITKYLS